MVMYKGFSTVSGNFRSNKLTDSELIKQDLINHFAIRKGEKVGNPEFGSSIMDLVHEPLTVEVKDMLLEEIKDVINSDPRVSVQELIVDEYLHGLQAQGELLYVQTNQVEKIQLKFNTNAGTIP